MFEKADLIQRLQRTIGETKVAYDRWQQLQGAAEQLQRMLMEVESKEKADAAAEAKAKEQESQSQRDVPARKPATVEIVEAAKEK